MRRDPCPLVIVGASGLGRETLAAVRVAAETGATWPDVAFVDDSPSTWGSAVDGVPVVGSVADLVRRLEAGEELDVVVSTGRPGSTRSRTELGRCLEACGAALASVVHPAACLAPGTEVGAGSVLLAGVVVTAPLDMGRQVVAMPHTVFTHDDQIGDGTTFGAGAKLSGGVRIGNGAYVGAGAVVREGLDVGRDAVVGMGAVVTRDVPAGEVWVGNPARPLRSTAGSGRAEPGDPAVAGGRAASGDRGGLRAVRVTDRGPR